MATSMFEKERKKVYKSFESIVKKLLQLGIINDIEEAYLMKMVDKAWSASKQELKQFIDYVINYYKDEGLEITPEEVEKALDIRVKQNKNVPFSADSIDREMVIDIIKKWKKISNIDNKNKKITIAKKQVWKDKVWEGGVWKDGIFENGVWKDGIWKNGTWKNGTWKNGKWYTGIWEGGIWKGGTHINGVWRGGTWLDGVWKGGMWMSGEWKGGEWIEGWIYDPQKKGNKEYILREKSGFVKVKVNPNIYFGKKKANVNKNVDRISVAKELIKVAKEMIGGLNPIQKHQKAIAIKTLKMNDFGVKMLGGMTKEEARKFLKSIGYTDRQIKKIEKS